MERGMLLAGGGVSRAPNLRGEAYSNQIFHGDQYWVKVNFSRGQTEFPPIYGAGLRKQTIFVTRRLHHLNQTNDDGLTRSLCVADLAKVNC